MNPRSAWLLLIPLGILLLATIEGIWMTAIGHPYDWRAYGASAGDMVIRFSLQLLPFGLTLQALQWLWAHRLYTMPLNDGWAWAGLFIGQEFLYYWMHRADHQIRWLWATHSVHHSPNDLNLSAAYRLGWTARSSFAPLFFAPLVLLGFPPLIVGAALAANLFYQFWLHATWLPRLGALEWVLNTPAHHRVHHASNPEYLDANFGGVLIVFDRLFGTFVAERADIAIRFGLVHPIQSYNPLSIGLHEWRAILADITRARSLRAALSAAFGPPSGPVVPISTSTNAEFSHAHE
jgi:sterol desaturase/sphingolipid hydroxylase (fatty acid hydroxylase superfamily)